MAKKKTTALAVRAKTAIKAIATVDPQALLARAIDKNLPIEQMERLLTMRREMKMEWARDQYFIALSGFQRDCPVVEKKHQVRDKDKQTREDKGLRYAYAPMEDMVETAKPHLERWGFSFTIKTQQSKEDVTAICHAHHRDGHEEVNSFTVPIDPDAYMSDPQKAAAALTFAARYAFKNAFGIQTKGEDRDQNLEQPKTREPIRQTQAAPAAAPQQNVLAPKNDYEKCIHYLEATEVDKGTGKTVKLFGPNEIVDYTNQANIARKNPAELKIVLDDIIATGKKRRAAVKGE
jgi:hypothetical protein